MMTTSEAFKVYECFVTLVSRHSNEDNLMTTIEVDADYLTSIFQFTCKQDIVDFECEDRVIREGDWSRIITKFNTRTARVESVEISTNNYLYSYPVVFPSHLMVCLQEETATANGLKQAMLKLYRPFPLVNVDNLVDGAFLPHSPAESARSLATQLGIWSPCPFACLL